MPHKRSSFGWHSQVSFVNSKSLTQLQIFFENGLVLHTINCLRECVIFFMAMFLLSGLPLIIALILPCATLGNTVPSKGITFPNNRTVAVFIAGLRIRFILRSFVQHVVQAAVRDGFTVHVYLSLVEFDPEKAFYMWHRVGHGYERLGPDPETGNLSSVEFRRCTREAIVAAGGQLLHFDSPRKPEKLDPLPEPTSFRGRMKQYSPYARDAGRNVLRMWKARERMWNVSRAVERENNAVYQFVVWTRDDAFWLGPIQLCAFPTATSGNVLYSRNCLWFGGINDKTVVMGRKAAAAVMVAYTAFWNPRLSLGGENAEQYLMWLARQQRVLVRGIDFALLPSTDCMVVAKTRQLCLKRFYSCLLTLPPWSPAFCGEARHDVMDNLQNWEQVWPEQPCASYCTHRRPITASPWPPVRRKRARAPPGWTSSKGLNQYSGGRNFVGMKFRVEGFGSQIGHEVDRTRSGGSAKFPAR